MVVWRDNHVGRYVLEKKFVATGTSRETATGVVETIRPEVDGKRSRSEFRKIH